jgi:GNAT superfamily N-acetyltransferase
VLEIKASPYDGAAAQALVEAVQQEYVMRYGGFDETPVEPGEFTPPHGLFFVGAVDGEAVACGGWRRLSEDEAEIKRMFVAAAHRRRGYSRLLLAELERTAAAAGYPRLRLMTGVKQPEAIALYEDSGWQRITPYGFYADDPGCVCFAKSLVAGD